MGIKKDLKIGSKFGKLTILENIYLGYNGGSKVKVQCDCGKIYIASKSGVKRGDIKQCYDCWFNNKRPSRRLGIGNMSGYFFGTIKRNAKARNLEFNLTKENLYQLYLKQNKKCALTNLPIHFDGYTRCNGTASLDRIDSSKGYELNNIQWIHKKLNIIKNKYSIEELIYWTDLIKNNKKVTLKRYIPDETEVSGDTCPDCGDKLIYQDGCVKCNSCSFSKCG